MNEEKKKKSEFQFHKGTIKTYVEYKTSVDEVQFQFHKGTIKTYCKQSHYLRNLAHFNSIKVRLKLNFR